MSSPLINSQKENIRNLVDSATSIGIIIGDDHTIDTVGAALGLYLTLEGEGKSVQIISRKDPIVEVSNLFGVNKITHSFEGQTSMLTISVPYREGEIEKVSYNIEGDHLNVNLFAEGSGISFSEKDVQYIRKGSSPSLIITIGVRNDSEIVNLVDINSVKIIHIDRDTQNEFAGDVTIVDPSFSSISEIITQLILDLGFFGDPDAFQNLMDGITYATRNFTLQQTSPFAFEAAGFLMQNGAKRKKDAPDQRPARSDNFPKEELFLNQTPRIQQTQLPQAPRIQEIPQAQIPQPQPVVRPQPISQPVQNIQTPAPSEASIDDFPFVTQPNVNKADGETENATPDEIPDDWFLPKVFKGSRKGN